ncbi:hypothetical protein [Bradyrhizobium sp. I1.7.5]|uniref:hypothetical protein n=1 Tax=Bradyrhizobium sp. I1.7.5 TaxID=3156363 RepID=UPI0033975C43
MAISFKGEIWLVGGVSDPRQRDEAFSNEIWSSVDGEKWTYHGHAAWSPRVGAALVTLGDKMWLLGGFDGKAYNNEVWSSSNGLDWVLESSAAPWSARAFHGAVNFRNSIWLMGGGVWEVNATFPNDVWRSGDGRTWEKVQKSAPWRGRLWPSAVVYDDAIWLIGGRYETDLDSRNIWRTVDGRTWDRIPGPAGFNRRHAPAVYEFKDRIWIAGGYEGGGHGGNDVWAFQHTPR